MRGDGALVRFKRVRDFLRQDIEQQRLGPFLKEVSLRDEIIEQREDDAITTPRFKTKNQVTKASGSTAGLSEGSRTALTIRSRTKPTIHSKVWRRSSTRSETTGQSAAQMITALEFLKPPRLIVTSQGSTRVIRSWMKR